MPPEESVDVIESPVESAVETVESAPVETVQTEERPVGPSRSERISKLSGKAKDYYQKTGDVEGAEQRMAKKAAQVEPGADQTAQTEEASGPSEVEQSSRTRQDRNFRQVTKKLTETERELIAAKAKLEIFERQSAASRTPAPATAKTEAQPVVSDDPRPAFPDIDAFDDPKKYSAAVKEWQKKDTDWTQRQFDRRLTGEQQRQQYQQVTQKWNEQLDSARKTHKDFDSVALNDKTPVSYATMAHIQGLPDGALRSYALGKNLEVATKIAELTHIPGEGQHKDFASFMKWVKSDPDRAMLYGEKLALAKAEIAKLIVSAAKGTALPTKPLKEIIRSAPKPSAEVNTEEPSVPLLDPIAQAVKNKDWKTYNRLKNEADLRKKRGR